MGGGTKITTARFNFFPTPMPTPFPELRKRTGQTVTVLGEVPLAPHDKAEAGPMYNIVFHDGYQNQAFAHELTEWEH